MAELEQVIDQLQNEIKVERTSLTSEDVYSLLKETLASNELFASEFKKRIIVPLTNEIGRKIRVSEININGKQVGEQITRDLSEAAEQSTKKAAKTIDKEIRDGTKDIGKKIQVSDIKIVVDEKALNRKLNKNIGISVDDALGKTPEIKKLSAKYQKILEDVVGDLQKSQPRKFELGKKGIINLGDFLGVDPRSYLLTRLNWNSLQNSILQKASRAVRDTEFDLEGSYQNINKKGKTRVPIDLKAFIGVDPKSYLLTRLNWNSLQNNIINKVSRAVSGVKFDLKKKIGLKEIFDMSDKSYFTTRLNWNILQNSIINNVYKAVKRVKFELEKKIGLDQIFNIDKRESLQIKHQWRGIQEKLLEEARKSIKEPKSKKKSLDKIVKEPKSKKKITNKEKIIIEKLPKEVREERNTLITKKKEESKDDKYKSLLEEEEAQKVEIVDINKKPIDSLTSSLEKMLGKVIGKKEEKKEPGIFDKLISKIGAGLSGLIGGAAATILGAVGKGLTAMGPAIGVAIAGAVGYELGRYLDKKTGTSNIVSRFFVPEEQTDKSLEIRNRYKKRIESKKYGKEYKEEVSYVKTSGKYRKRQKEINEKIDEMEQRKQKRINFLNRGRQIPLDERERNLIIEERAKLENELNEEIQRVAAKRMINRRSISAAPVKDFIWRKGKPIQPIDERDNIIGVKSDKRFDKILNAFEKATAHPEARQPEPHRDIDILVKKINEFIEVERTRKDGGPERGSQQVFGNLEGIRDDAGEIRDPAYILRGRVWERLNKRAYVVV